MILSVTPKTEARRIVIGRPINSEPNSKIRLSILGRGSPFTKRISKIDEIPAKKKLGIRTSEILTAAIQRTLTEFATADSIRETQKKAAVMGAGESFQSLCSGVSQCVSVRIIL